MEDQETTYTFPAKDGGEDITLTANRPPTNEEIVRFGGIAPTWMQQHPKTRQVAKGVLDALPAVGAMSGAAVAGPETFGVGSVPAGIFGAAAGRYVRDQLAEAIGVDDPTGPLSKSSRIALDTFLQAATPYAVRGLKQVLAKPTASLVDVLETVLHPKIQMQGIADALRAAHPERLGMQEWEQHPWLDEIPRGPINPPPVRYSGPSYWGGVPEPEPMWPHQGGEIPRGPMPSMPERVQPAFFNGGQGVRTTPPIEVDPRMPNVSAGPPAGYGESAAGVPGSNLDPHMPNVSAEAGGYGESAAGVQGTPPGPVVEPYAPNVSNATPGAHPPVEADAGSLPRVKQAIYVKTEDGFKLAPAVEGEKLVPGERVNVTSRSGRQSMVTVPHGEASAPVPDSTIPKSFEALLQQPNAADVAKAEGLVKSGKALVDAAKQVAKGDTTKAAQIMAAIQAKTP